MAHICSYLSSTASKCANFPLFNCGDRSTTAKDAIKRVASLAVVLRQRLHAQVGDCICLAALTTDYNLESLLAITSAGCIAAPLNWRWGSAEGAYAAELVGAKLLLADAACLDFAVNVAKACKAVQSIVLLGDPESFAEADLGAVPVPIIFTEALISTCVTSSLELRFAPRNAALVVFTSGTTGRPKGVVLTHTALHVQSLAKLLMVGYSKTDVYLHAAPLFHIGGISSALAMLMAGARHVFLPRFAPEGFLKGIREHGVTSFIAVPAMIAALVDAAGGAVQGSGALGCVRTILLGGGGTPPALQAGLRGLFPHAAVHTAYGMTEACSSMTFHNLWSPATPPMPTTEGQQGCGDGGSEAEQKLEMRGPAHVQSGGSLAAVGVNGSPPDQEFTDTGAPAGGVYVGQPPPGVELAIYHPATTAMPATKDLLLRSAGGDGGKSSRVWADGWGRVVQEGEGEVVTRGPHTMDGYWADGAASQAAFVPGGWMRTGDLGHICKGRLWLMGRAKDMIKSGGENVHAWEVERVLAEHPAVASVAVVGCQTGDLGRQWRRR